MTLRTDLPTSPMMPAPRRLSGGAGDFARRGGQLRVSLTPRCQLGCWFCHNEGEIPPRITHHDRAVQPRRRALNAGDFLAAINAMTAAGIRRVFFTGGEPLLSPLARPILQGLPGHQMDEYTTTLITNGLTLAKDLDWLAATALDRIKVSLHYFSDASIAAIAQGRPGDMAKIKAGIEAAIGTIPIVELNLLLQEQNAHEVMDVIAYARELGTGLQIIELVDTDHNAGLSGVKVASGEISACLRSIATAEDVVTAGTGQGRRVFTVPGRGGPMTIEVIDATLGRHHVGQCASCPERERCIEGFWALRLDSAGALSPCLLRPDLRLDVTSRTADPAALLAAVSAHLDAFTEGTLA
ncbi:radical SAM protein [Nonomuraea bangladeshensis]